MTHDLSIDKTGQDRPLPKKAKMDKHNRSLSEKNLLDVALSIAVVNTVFVAGCYTL